MMRSTSARDAPRRHAAGRIRRERAAGQQDGASANDGRGNRRRDIPQGCQTARVSGAAAPAAPAGSAPAPRPHSGHSRHCASQTPYGVSPMRPSTSASSSPSTSGGRRAVTWPCQSMTAVAPVLVARTWPRWNSSARMRENCRCWSWIMRLPNHARLVALAISVAASGPTIEVGEVLAEQILVADQRPHALARRPWNDAVSTPLRLVADRDLHHVDEPVEARRHVFAERQQVALAVAVERAVGHVVLRVEPHQRVGVAALVVAGEHAHQRRLARLVERPLVGEPGLERDLHRQHRQRRLRRHHQLPRRRVQLGRRARPARRRCAPARTCRSAPRWAAAATR